MGKIKPYSHIKTNQKIFELLTSRDIIHQKIIDIGAGEGYFLEMLGDHLTKLYSVKPSTVLRACDLYPENFKYLQIPCDRINANGDLPYKDGEFDSVCCIEVVEHIEDQFHFVRELYRIARDGGRVFITTPNILNLNSRISFMYSGFAKLFYPVSLGSKDPVHKGHIHPISFYYLAYIFHWCGFKEIKVHFDRRKKSGFAWTVWLYLPIAVLHFFWRLRMKKRSPKIYEENKGVLKKLNSFDMLSCRTVILEGVK